MIGQHSLYTLQLDHSECRKGNNQTERARSDKCRNGEQFSIRWSKNRQIKWCLGGEMV